MGVRNMINVLAVGVLLVGLAAPANSRADSWRPPRDAGSPLEHFMAEQAEQLGLDEGTRAAIRAIADASRARSEAIRNELRTAYTRMRALLSQDLPDEAAVMQQADAIGTLKTAESKNRLQAMLQIRALLTPTQRQELIRLQGELRSRRRIDLTPACQRDSTRLCPDAAPGRALLQCLHDHVHDLSEACRAAVQSREEAR